MRRLRIKYDKQGNIIQKDSICKMCLSMKEAENKNFCESHDISKVCYWKKKEYEERFEKFAEYLG